MSHELGMDPRILKSLKGITFKLFKLFKPFKLFLGFRYLFLIGSYAASLSPPGHLPLASALQAASSLCPAYFSPESTKKAAHVGGRWWR